MLTTIIAARRRLRLPDTADDDWLDAAIKWSTGHIEGVCNRDFGLVAGAVQNFAGGDCAVLLRRYPVASLDGVDIQNRDTWDPLTLADLDYTLDAESGVLQWATPLGGPDGIARVTYTGGYVLPGDEITAGQIALPADLEVACLELVANWYQRRDQLGLTSVSAGGGSATQIVGLNLLPLVKESIEPYRRMKLI